MKIFKSLATVKLVALVAITSGHTQGQQLEEIVVTAQKRSESLQETPVAVSAYNETALANYGIADMGDLVVSSPALQAYDFPTSTSNISLFLRGFGNTDSQTLTIDNPVGVYVDGVYIARTTGATVDVLDLERVEILRGPQGTLYGRNSTAGAINFISKKPADEFGGTLKISAGNFGYVNLGGSLDIPLSESFRSKVSVQRSSTDGWVENTGPTPANGPAEDFYAEDQTAIRIALSWELSEKVTLDYSYDFADVDSQPPYYQQNPAFRQESTSHLFLGGGAYQFVLPTSTTETSGHNLTLNWDISDSLQFKSVTGIRDMEERAIQNWSDTLFFATDVDWNTDAVSQEFQLSGNSPENQLQWIAGLYYFKEEGDKAEQQFTNAPTMVFDALAAPGANSSLLIGGTSLGTHTIDSDLTSRAAYVQGTYALADHLDITAGLRYTDDSRQAIRGVDAANPSIQFAPGSNNLDYTRTDWNLTLNYQFNEDVHTYFRAASGYRAGGSAERTLTFDQTFNEESAVSYEVGLKSEFMENRVRLNAALFRTEFDDLLLTISGEPPTFASFVEVFNAGQATYEGLEIDLTALLSESTQLSLSYAYLNTDLQDVVVPQTSFLQGGAPASAVDLRGLDISGRTFIAFAPENAFTLAIDHGMDTGVGRLNLHVNYAWRDTLFSQPGLGLPVGSLGLLNARASLTDLKISGQAVELAVWGKNLADTEKVIYNLSNFGFQFNQPLSFGVDARLNF